MEGKINTCIDCYHSSHCSEEGAVCTLLQEALCNHHCGVIMACFYQDHKCWCKIINRGPVAISFHNQLKTQTGPRAALWETSEPSLWSEWAKGRAWGAVVPAGVWTSVRCECKSLLQLKDLAASCWSFLEFPKVEQEAFSCQTAVWHDANKSESNYTKEEKTRLWTNYFCMNSVSFTKSTRLAFSSLQ